ncbi:MAG: inositol monophosphatase family protein [Moorea sp. SIO3C2]|nr:inositol monophosphatase family protein [Moorena sp. SIO3C2]
MATPREILAALLPHLKVAAGYANTIQTSIAAHPDKFDSENFFATALTDADLSIQTFVEVTLLSLFPNVRFYGEEFEKTYNTKYFRSIELGDQDDYLITLDPIDGTRFYMDGHPNYQIILTILNADGYEAVIALTPARNTLYYTLWGEGTYHGTLSDDLDSCQKLTVTNPKNQVLLGWTMKHLTDAVTAQGFAPISVQANYSKTVTIPNVNGLMTGDLTGAILAQGKFIDGGALSWMAQEMGYILTTYDGKPMPAPKECSAEYQWPGLVVASSPEIHTQLLSLLQ